MKFLLTILVLLNGFSCKETETQKTDLKQLKQKIQQANVIITGPQYSLEEGGFIKLPENLEEKVIKLLEDLLSKEYEKTTNFDSEIAIQFTDKSDKSVKLRLFITTGSLRIAYDFGKVDKRQYFRAKDSDQEVRNKLIDIFDSLAKNPL